MQKKIIVPDFTGLIAKEVTRFLKDNFKVCDDAITYYKTFFENNKLDIPTKDYIKLKQFIDSAINHFKAMDHELHTGLLYKFHMEVQDIESFYKKLKRENQASQAVYMNHFLPSVKYYKDLSDLEDNLRLRQRDYEATIKETTKFLEATKEPKSRSEVKKIKSTKSLQVDAIHYLAYVKDTLADALKKKANFEKQHKKAFCDAFEAKMNKIDTHFSYILNLKIHYLELLFWDKARKSVGVRRFFKEAKIKGGMNTRTFIEYTIKNFDINVSKNNQYYEHLKACLKEAQ